MRLKLENNTILPSLLTNLNGGGGNRSYNLLKSTLSPFKRFSSRFTYVLGSMPKSICGLGFPFLLFLLKGGMSLLLTNLKGGGQAVL